MTETAESIEVRVANAIASLEQGDPESAAATLQALEASGKVNAPETIYLRGMIAWATGELDTAAGFLTERGQALHLSQQRCAGIRAGSALGTQPDEAR